MTKTEFEYKWDAYDRNDFAVFLSCVREFVHIAGSHEMVLEDFYFDSTDGAYSKTQTACRIRKEGKKFVLTLKEKTKVQNGLAVRGEDNHPLKADAYDAAVKEAEKFLKKKLKFLFSLTNERIVYAVKNSFNAELCFDSFTINLKQGKIAMKEVELEYKGGDMEDFKHVAGLLTKNCSLKPAETSKVKTALAALQYYGNV